MSIITDRGILFINKVLDGYSYKQTNNVDPDMGFISSYKSVETIDRILNKIDLTISGQLNIDDRDISTDDGGIAFVTTEGIEFWDMNVENVVGICPLNEFKELLIAWKDFLQSPPFHRFKVN